MNSPPMSVTAHKGMLKAAVLHSRYDLGGEDSLRRAKARCLHNGGDDALGNMKQGQHQLHAIGDSALGKRKSDK